MPQIDQTIIKKIHDCLDQNINLYNPKKFELNGKVVKRKNINRKNDKILVRSRGLSL
jgi:hypothetical protein